MEALHRTGVPENAEREEDQKAYLNNSKLITSLTWGGNQEFRSRDRGKILKSIKTIQHLYF